MLSCSTAQLHCHGFPMTKDEDKVNMLFRSIDLCIDEKSITCILGENRGGKTTLLKICKYLSTLNLFIHAVV